MNDPDPVWLEARAEEALALARSADDPAVKAAHLDRAAHFAAAREQAAIKSDRSVR